MRRNKPVATFGLTHIALAVRNPKRSAAFYSDVFGMVAVYSDGNFVQLQTPGSRDVLVLERAAKAAGAPGGVRHFGFRLRRPKDIVVAAEAIERAGGRLLRKGEFVPGEPYVFFADPDGYEVEVWYELPTTIDPRAKRRAT